MSIWVKLGLDSIDNLKIILLDSYTVTETAPMVYPVLTSLFYGLLYKIRGLELVAVIHAFIPAVWLYFWFGFIKKYSPAHRNVTREVPNLWNLRTLMVFLISSQGLTLIYLPRPAMISTIFILGSYYLITILKDRPFNTVNILQFLLIEILWVNFHGSFLILPLILAWQLPFLLLEKKYLLFRNRLRTLGLVLLAALINPFGWKVFPYILETAVISKTRKIDEWFPTHHFNFPVASWYFYIFSAVFIWLMATTFKKRRTILELFSDSFFMFWLSGFFAIRNTFFVFLVLPVFLFDKIFLSRDEVPAKTGRFSPLLNILVITLVGTAAFALNPFLKNKFSRFLPEKYQSTFDSNYRAEKINSFLVGANGNVFNTWEFGSDLALGQNNKYFIDTRNIIFSESVANEYVKFLYEPEKSRGFLTKYHFKYYVVHSNYSKLFAWLLTQPDFKLVIDEAPAFLFEKVGNLGY